MNSLELVLTEPHDRVLELKVRGEIDMATAPSLREAAIGAASSGSYDSIVIDLLGVGFIDSTGLHVLTEAHRAMLGRGGRAEIVCKCANLLKVFQLTGLDQMLLIVDQPDGPYAEAA